ncbi:acyl-ACP thioesterase [Weissella diestrammenae]|uniref:Acyl-ACP thioesterase n=1 Tax=Weissella diestrammenae TaxID=1162633 RepID=A0A7G9T3J4_9LACO|nr:acyl-ACP thioesterase domain-containing protein [Weissella diestrammenae]MCM0582640.1 acyl-ACP thioesterase [Weissella diestrammenae]QNN74669.1 acyl-ACP thioesterase [Weissella diestrammenae]
MKVYEIEHEVLYYEGDMTGKLNLPTILNLAILSSTEQAIDYGVGPEYTHNLGLGWIILQHIIDIKRRPEIGERIKVSTHAKELNPFFCKRDYTFVDAQGIEIIKIDTLYAMIDMTKRKMARIPEDIAAAFDPTIVKKIARQTAPLTMTDDMSSQQQDYRVRFTDIDSNQHVNNSKYLNWTQDILGPEFLLAHEPRHVNIKFEHEVRLGEIVTSRVAVIGNQSRHQIIAGDELAAEASIDWTENQ